MLGDKIKDRREYLGMSRKKLADIVGCSVPTVFKIEKGESDPRIDILAKIASALEVRIDYLLDRTNQEKCRKKCVLDYRSRFAEARHKRNLSRSELCGKAGISSFVVQEAENKSKPCWTRNIEAACDVLGISLDWLFGRRERMEI